MSNEIVYKANGQDIKLSPSIVHQFVTKGDGNITQQEAVNFIQLCRYAELNPFLNEVYLVKYGSQPAQMVTAKEALLKRAARQSDYRGLTSGLVVITKDGNVTHKKGQMLYPNETLLGAWAQLVRDGFPEPFYVEVALEEYNKGKSTWKQMPANMINKVAQAKVLREAYPEQLGALYTDAEPVFHDEPLDKNGEPLEFAHNEPVSEPTGTIGDKIKELLKEIADKDPRYRTQKAVKEYIGQKNNLSFDDLSEEKILKELLLMNRNIPKVVNVEEEVEDGKQETRPAN